MKTTNMIKGILGLALGLTLATSSWAAPAVVDKGTGIADIEGEFYLPCVGEVVHEFTTLYYEYHVVTTPNGDYAYHDLTLNASSTLIGESGTVWTLKKAVSPFIDRSTGGAMTHYFFRSTFANETGSTLEFRTGFHISFDANGELKVERLEPRCWVKD